ncbi:disease resistance protein RGA5-like [Oryza glaberrima]|uniref:disease resistance protein RGA5-like n=1 Tax=Oryza glaberrima TaxID=4538 RepID=UPI00023DF3EC|nr:disease resistance protein RGA5-like [Oryza glaberrima]
MADSALSAVMGPLLSKMQIMVENESAQLREVKRRITSLQAELEAIRQFLPKAPEVDDPQTKVWMTELRELSYDIEDYVDKLMVNYAGSNPGFKPRRGKGLMARTRSLLNRARTNRRIDRELEELKGRVSQVSKQRDRLRLRADPAAAPPASDKIDGGASVDPRIQALFAEASRFEGMDGPRDELIDLLKEEEEESSESAARLKVVSIVGFGGLGKTTLAKQVFGAIGPQFDCQACVSVTQSYNTRGILTELLRQVQIQEDTIDEEGKWDERDLVNKIRESLQNRRYLLVLDDIWSLESWEIIKLALPMNSLCSRIITTTRVQRVAQSCCSHWNDVIYEIRPLSMHDSRRLFNTRIYGSEDSCPPDLVEVSDNILKKCAGVPLAIITIASLLATKGHTKEQWLKVGDSVGISFAGSTTLENMRHTLYLSYSDLPYHLRSCFLYLSVFPEDHVITRDRLVMRWIAEGFIVEEPGRNPKELGESYFNELINRSMIQPVHFGYDGQPEDCRVHDLVRDFIVSMSTEENFAISLGDQEPASISHNRIRRLALNNINEKQHFPDLVSQSQSHMRSLTVFGSLGSIPSLQNFSLLRVLDLEDCQNLGNQHFKEIGSLWQLRYLNIRHTRISELPDEILALKFLETLDLRGTGVLELQANVVQLHKLAFLLCDNRLRLPEGIGSMKTLHLVSQFDVLRNKIAVVEELGNLSNLTELVIWWSPSVDSDNIGIYERFASSLYRLNKLQSLTIHGTDSSVDLLDHLYHPIQELKKFKINKDCYLRRIPKWFRSLPNLSYVCIDVKEVKNKDLQLLLSLPSLIHLSLTSRVVPTEHLAIRSNGFLVLREFHLHSDWANLTFEPESMPKVERLFLAFNVLAAEKYGFSISIENLKYLKKFDVRINSEGANASQVKAVEDAIKNAADNHPNSPILSILTLGNLVNNEGRDEANKPVY